MRKPDDEVSLRDDDLIAMPHGYRPPVREADLNRFQGMLPQQVLDILRSHSRYIVSCSRRKVQ